MTAASRSDGVLHWALGVGAAGRRGPPVPSGSRLGDAPPLGLLDLMASAGSGSGVAGACPAAPVIGGGVLEVRFPGVPGAGRECARAVTDLDQVPEHIAGLV